MQGPELKGLRVLVTRPEAQARKLCEDIRLLGGEPIALPLLEIQPLPVDEVRRPDLTQVDLLIFISANAVEHGLARLGTLPADLQLGAIGQASAERLIRAGYRVDALPTRQDSEGFLALPQMQSLHGRRVLIVRGRGGREKLAETLRARGARVDYLEVYRRACPRWNANAVATAMRADVITLTSTEALDNLAALAREPAGGALLDKPLLVFHARIAGRARELGFTLKPVVTAQPGDEAMLASLLQWMNERKGTHQT